MEAIGQNNTVNEPVAEGIHMDYEYSHTSQRI